MSSTSFPASADSPSDSKELADSKLLPSVRSTPIAAPSYESTGLTFPCHDDVRNFAGIECDVICGGFPCQDISIAGQQVGIEGARSGLWTEYARLVGKLRPRYVIVENVAALLGYGLSRICGDLAEIGYDAEWECLPAAFIGAPHQRERIFLIAYPDSVRRTRCVLDYAEYEIPAYEGWRHTENLKSGTQWKHWAITAAEALDGEISSRDFHRMDDGLRADLVRIEALGNAVVPQIIEIIGKAILEAENMR